MLINLIVDYSPIDVDQVSECQILVKALEYYKCNVLLSESDSTATYALDNIQHKITLALVAAVEELSMKARESRGV